MMSIWLVQQFHKLSRTIEFDLFGFLNLKVLIFKVDISTEILLKLKIENMLSVDNV